MIWTAEIRCAWLDGWIPWSMGWSWSRCPFGVVPGVCGERGLAATVEQRAPTLLPFSCPHQENDKAVPKLPMLLCSMQMFWWWWGHLSLPGWWTCWSITVAVRRPQRQGTSEVHTPHYDTVLFILPLVVGIHFVNSVGLWISRFQSDCSHPWPIVSGF